MIEASSINNLIKKYHENMLSHAFLLETDDLDKCYSDIISFIKIINCSFEYKEDCNEDCKLCRLIDCNNLPSLITIEAVDNYIKKDQILSLIDSFSTKPVFSKYNVYIVKDASKFNASSANTLLKFLEEPEDDIIGFFIVNNLQNVIPTIRSRCQILSCRYNNINEDKNILYKQQIVEYLENIYKNDEDLLYNRLTMVKVFEERSEWEEFFKSMLYFFLSYYKNYDIETNNYKFKIEKDDIISAVNLVKDSIKSVKANGNVEIILDRFVIEMRKYYE